MKLLKRKFLNIEGVEVEICEDTDHKYFVRHHTYWHIVHDKKNPDPVLNCVIQNLEIMANNRLSTIKWAGYNFQFQKVAFDDGMEIETVLLPLNMFEDFVRYQSKNHYKGIAPDNERTRLGQWLENNPLTQAIL